MRIVLAAALSTALIVVVPACSTKDAPAPAGKVAVDSMNSPPTSGAAVTPTATMPPATPQVSDKPADNTAHNADTVPAPTADEQPMQGSDVDKLALVRKTLVADGSLSTSAHNIKIVVDQSHVTLRGPVVSAAEKAAVEATVSRLMGSQNVTSELTIAP